MFNTAQEAYDDILREAKESGVSPAGLMRSLPNGYVTGSDADFIQVLGVTAGKPRSNEVIAASADPHARQDHLIGADRPGGDDPVNADNAIDTTNLEKNASNQSGGSFDAPENVTDVVEGHGSTPEGENVETDDKMPNLNVVEVTPEA